MNKNDFKGSRKNKKVKSGSELNAAIREVKNNDFVGTYNSISDFKRAMLNDKD
jgi:hypothetical protein